ncbi:hypothetical protein PV04_05774 [Phialophora macrospora]|uniref:Uncharacterized protein n=1 Tax=Phialophora macrospora TaxID=1851006 RepID=A0A0D2G2W9_9EURO|nr:hypothetical protein PV04_05774 [Phialophora macrospora]
MASFERNTSSSPSHFRLVNTDDLCETCAALVSSVDRGHNTSSQGAPQSSSSSSNSSNNNNNSTGNGNGNGDNGTNEPSISTPQSSEISEPSSNIVARAAAPVPTTDDIIQLIMISELRDAEEKLEREGAKLEREGTKLEREVADLEAARRAFEHERRGVLASMRNAREALRTATDDYWQNTHSLSVAMTAFRREKHEFETEKAAVEEARQALNLEREAFEAERQAAEVEEGGATGKGRRKRKLWRRVAGWLGRR